MARGRTVWIFVLFLTILRAEDWRMFLGDLPRTSYTADATVNPGNVGRLRQLWRTSIGVPVSAAVTAVGGRLYVGDWGGHFYAINGRTGAILWTTFVGTAPTAGCPGAAFGPNIGVGSQAVVSGGTVYVGGGDAAVYALDAATGEIQWRTALGDVNAGYFIWSSPLVWQNALYIGVSSLGDCPLVRGALVRIPLNDPAHPLIHYLVPEGETGAGVWSSPSVDEAAGIVYVTTGNASGQDATRGVWGSALLAMDATSLEIEHYFFLPLSAAQEDEDMDWGSSPTLIDTPDGEQYVAANGKNGVFYVFHRPDLGVLWTYPVAIACAEPISGCGSVSAPSFNGSVVFTGAGASSASHSPPGSVYAFDWASGTLLWTYGAPGVVLAPVTVTPGLVMVPSTRGFAILDAGTGAVLWTDGGSAPLYSQAAVSDGLIYTTYMNGDIVAWRTPDAPGTLRAPPRR
ncbi:MAG TPA: PQQ-binding-like beta-propeller repeat protein [Bryobacteraceae bacterium]|nr:PQQ-binding-like beta-propeller repeat protein [Bryobacteraceae bacterium]